MAQLTRWFPVPRSSGSRRGRERVYHLNERELRSVTGDWLCCFNPAARRGRTRGHKRGVRKGLKEEE